MCPPVSNAYEDAKKQEWFTKPLKVTVTFMNVHNNLIYTRYGYSSLSISGSLLRFVFAKSDLAKNSTLILTDSYPNYYFSRSWNLSPVFVDLTMEDSIFLSFSVAVSVSPVS